MSHSVTYTAKFRGSFPGIHGRKKILNVKLDKQGGSYRPQPPSNDEEALQWALKALEKLKEKHGAAELVVVVKKETITTIKTTRIRPK